MRLTVINEHGIETVLDSATWINGERFIRRFLGGITDIYDYRPARVSGVNTLLARVDSDLTDPHTYLLTFGSDVRRYLESRGKI